jgi:hypothetical protein
MEIDSKNYIAKIDWDDWKKGLELLMGSLFRDEFIVTNIESKELNSIFEKLPLIILWVYSKGKGQIEDNDTSQLALLFLKLNCLICNYNISRKQRFRADTDQEVVGLREKKYKSEFYFWFFNQEFTFMPRTNEYFRILHDEIGKIILSKDVFSIVSQKLKDVGELPLYKTKKGDILLCLSVRGEYMSLYSIYGENRNFPVNAPLAKVNL